MFSNLDVVSFWFQRNHTVSGMEDDGRVWDRWFHGWNHTHGNDARGY